MGWIPMEAPIVFRFLLTLVVLPWFVVLVIRLRDARHYTLLAFAFYALCLADAATVIERGLGVDWMDIVQHGLYAAAGLMSVIGVLMVRRHVLEGGGRG
jgi:hypothetical protein